YAGHPRACGVVQRMEVVSRHVLNGAWAKEVIVPVLINERPPDDETREEKRERVARLISFKAVRAVFALSDTDGPEIPPRPSPGWDLATALDTLGIREVPFDNTNGTLQGRSQATGFAINPIAVNRLKTTYHELGHVLLGPILPHHFKEFQTHRGVIEFQAEATAYLVMNELELMDDETTAHSRGYSRHRLGEEQLPAQAMRQVFTAADRIVSAARLVRRSWARATTSP